MRLRSLTITIVLFFALINAAFPQGQNITLKRFSTRNISYEDGLLDNDINSVVTDTAGFTWISTLTGLQRYNGYQLKTINPVIDHDTFNINYPVYLFGLNDGSILISMQNGLMKYDQRTNLFRLVIKTQPNNFYHFSIVPVKETRQGLWCLQQNKGIVLYSSDGKLLQAYSPFNVAVINDVLHSDNILHKQIVASNDQYVYVIDQLKRVLCIDAKSKTGIVIKTDNNILFGVVALNDKLFLLEKNSLVILDSNGLGNKKVIPLDSTENVTVSSLSKADEGHMFLSRNNHLYIVDAAGNFQYQLTDRNKQDLVVNANIERVYADKFNRIWVLSNNDIKRIENKELLFQNFSSASSQSNFIRALYYDTSKNILLAGGFNGMIQAYDTLANPLWQQIVTKASEYVLSIEKLTANEYLIIPFKAAPFIFNIETKRSYALVSTSSAIQNAEANFPCNLQRINDSTVLIATNNNVYKCIFINGRLTSAQPLINFIHDNRLNCFLYDANKRLWVGTGNGLVFMIDSNRINDINIPGNFTVRSMAEDDVHQLYVGTEKGLFIYNNNGKLVGRYNIASGLRNDCIYAIATLGNDCFVSTNLGISSITANGVINNYSREMGLQENEFNTNAVLKMKNGKLFFGGVNGITAFYPSALTQVKDTPQIHITDLVINDVSQNTSSGIWFGDAIKLNYKQSHLHFGVAAMGMLNANEYVYQYRLSGFDTIWQTTYRPTNLNYILQPGNYTLEIKCHPLFSRNVVFTKSFSIIITSPFWQTWWFAAIEFVCIVAVIYFSVYRYNRSRYLRKIRLLETQQQIQTERERISRELHDSIGTQLSFIISNIDWTIDSSERMTKAEEMQKLTSINEAAKNVMSNLRESIWALNKEKITIEEFADKLKLYIKNILELRPGLELVSKENIRSNISFSSTETLNLFRICQEVINNAIKHAQATLIKIYIWSDENKFSILIEDNGKGFDVSQQVNGHYGLQNMRYRAQELDLSIEIQSEIGMGTKVLIG
jgi:ligand-binding sensor domain-containing protein/two-component sensor histidine kinase